MWQLMKMDQTGTRNHRRNSTWNGHQTNKRTILKDRNTDQRAKQIHQNIMNATHRNSRNAMNTAHRNSQQQKTTKSTKTKTSKQTVETQENDHATLTHGDTVQNPPMKHTATNYKEEENKIRDE